MLLSKACVMFCFLFRNRSDHFGPASVAFPNPASSTSSLLPCSDPSSALSLSNLQSSSSEDCGTSSIPLEKHGQKHSRCRGTSRLWTFAPRLPNKYLGSSYDRFKRETARKACVLILNFLLILKSCVYLSLPWLAILELSRSLAGSPLIKSNPHKSYSSIQKVTCRQ